MPVKEGDKRWAKQREKELRTKKSKAGKLGAAARIAKFPKYEAGYDNNQKKNPTKPPTRYRSRVKYDFLKYIRIVFKWALENNPDLSRGEIELLLYLYGVGAFSMKQFADFHRTLALYHIKSLKKFEEGGWIKLWRKANRAKRQHKLYVLTAKAKGLCSSMHKYACGEAEIPMKANRNAMALDSKPRINRYYLDIIKKMNKDKVKP